MATEQWQISEPQVLRIGEDGAPVRALAVGLIGGHIDVITHQDSADARVEVHEVVGRPLTIDWDGRELRIVQLRDGGAGIWEHLKNGRGWPHDSAHVSVSVPRDATCSVSTVSASAVISGLRSGVRANTVSGAMTVEDVTGQVRFNAVSGSIEAQGLDGSFTADNVSGEILVQRSRLDPIKLNTVSGDITLDLSHGRATVTSSAVSGNVTLRMPHTDGYAVNVSTVSGHAIVDGRELGNGKRWGRGGHLADGDEALRVKASSVSGDVIVLRAAAGADLRKPAVS